MVKCGDCRQEMSSKKTKTCSKPYIWIGGRRFKRNDTYFDKNARCHDCNIVNLKGNIHHFGCDVERCPKCRRQLISCLCTKGGRITGED